MDSEEEEEVQDRGKENVAVQAARKEYDLTKNDMRKENTRVKDKIRNVKRDVGKIVEELAFEKPCCTQKKNFGNCMRWVHRVAGHDFMDFIDSFVRAIFLNTGM